MRPALLPERPALTAVVGSLRSQTPIVIVSATYQSGDYTSTGSAKDKDGSTKTMTLDELLPMSFGPGELEMGQRK